MAVSKMLYKGMEEFHFKISWVETSFYGDDKRGQNGEKYPRILFWHNAKSRL